MSTVTPRFSIWVKMTKLPLRSFSARNSRKAVLVDLEGQAQCLKGIRWLVCDSENEGLVFGGFGSKWPEYPWCVWHRYKSRTSPELGQMVLKDVFMHTVTLVLVPEVPGSFRVKLRFYPWVQYFELNRVIKQT